MPDETEPAEDDLVGQWHEHPVTRKFIENIRGNLAAAKVSLESACQNTSDPLVARWYVLVKALKKNLEDAGA